MHPPAGRTGSRPHTCGDLQVQPQGALQAAGGAAEGSRRRRQRAQRRGGGETRGQRPPRQGWQPATPTQRGRE
eukprot:15437724-Alexandrium_andersonii.AAC.1